MAKRSATKIAEYVEARRELRLFRRQLAAHPEVGKHPTWIRDYEQARYLVASMERDLKGSELGKATRILAGDVLPPTP